MDNTKKSPQLRPAPEQSPEPIRRFETRADLEAAQIAEAVMPAIFQQMIGLPTIGLDGAKKYIEQFVTKAVKSDDPVEQLLVQQIILLNQRIMHLHGQANLAKLNDEVKIYNGAAARLCGEFRRMVLALRQYRAPIVTKSATFVKLQAVADHQDVHFIDRSSGPKIDEKIVLSERIEVEGNAPSKGDLNARITPADEEFETRNGWQAQRLKAATVDG